jgi:anti-anti-sigma factor
MSSAQGAGLEREDFGDVTVLRLKVAMLRTDEATEALFEQTYSLVDQAGRSRLVLNCDGLDFLSSMALGKLVTLMRKTRAGGGKLALCKVNRTIDKVLQTARLADVLLNYEDEQAAIRSFR